MRNDWSQLKILVSLWAFFNGIIKSFPWFILVFFILATNPLHAIPQGGHVAHGNVSVNHSGNTMHINQTSNKAIINWKSYNISPKEHVRYQQPSKSSISLNRVDPSSGVSKIYGSITSNGQVWLLNPSGIWFGPSAYVNVAGLIATTAGISDDDFLAGRYSFVPVPGWHGSVINEGTIKIAEAGLAALVGQGVVNNGLIEANLGSVVLATGNAFTVSFSGNEMIHFKVDGAATQLGRDQNGNQLADAVNNAGTIIANGGKIMMTARTASDVLDHTINMKGIAQANSVRVQNGEIIFDAGHGKVNISGKVLASGKNKNEKGGTVKVTGKTVMLTDNALIDVSGSDGGGTVLVGGNAHGAGPEQNAQYALLDTNAVINADALINGHGGKVVLWADKATGFYGNIFARGGAEGGDGGWVETSGKEYLEATGLVSANAVKGNPGSWLLDPANVTISLGLTVNGIFSGGLLETFNTTANTAVANALTIMTALNLGTSVAILTTPAGTQAGNIVVATPITKSVAIGSPTLTLTAVGSVTVNSAISANALAGPLNVVLNGDSVALNAAVSTNGGDFTSITQNGTTFSNSIDAGSGLISINANQDGVGAQNFSMNAGASITTTNASANAVSINVNTASGGAGAAAIRDIITGDGGTVTIRTDTGGNITGGDITMVAGNSIDVGSGSVTLMTPQITGANIGTAALPIQVVASTINATTGSSGVFITNSGTNPLDVGTIDSLGAFTLDSTTSSSITNSAPITVSGITTLVAGAAQDITLNNASNDFATLRVTSGNNVTVNDISGIILGASTISGLFDLTTNGAITQSAAVSVANGVTLNAGASNNITLSNASNNFSTASIVQGNNVNLRDANAIDLGTSNISGTLLVTASGVGGGITQSGPLSVLGTTTLVGGAANDVSLADPVNDFSTVAVTSGNNVSLRDQNSLALGASTVSGTFDVISDGTLSQVGALVVSGLTTLAVGALNDVVLSNTANNFSTVAITNANNATLYDTDALILGTSNASTSLSATAEGALSQSGAITVPSLAALTRLTGGGAITLTDSGNEVTSVDLRARNAGNTANAPGAISYVDASGFDIVAANTTSTVTLTGNDAITQSGSMTGTTLTTKTLNNLGAAITLTDLANTFATIDLRSRNAADTASASGAISYTDANSVIIGAIETGSTFALTAGTSITQTGALIVTGLSTFIGSLVNTDFLLANAANDLNTTPVFTTTGAGTLRDVSLRNISGTAAAPSLPATLRNLTFIFDNTGIQLPGITLTGTLSATTNGAITQDNALVVTGTSTLAVGAANNITLNHSGNNFSTVAITSGNNVVLQDINALILGPSTVSGLLDVATNGALTDSGILTVTGVATLAAGLANDITLNTAGNDFSTVTINSADDVTLVDINSLILGAMNIADDATITTAGNITQSGPLTPGGTMTLSAGAANDITFNNAANDFNTVGITSANNVSLVDSDGLNLAGSTVSGDMTVSTGDALTDSGNLIVNGVNGLTVTAIGGIALNSGSNQIGRANINNSGSGNIALTSIVPLTIAGFSQSGGGTTTFTDTGTLTIANGVTINSNNATLAINATDLDLSATGELNSGTANTTITQNTVGGSLGLGNTAGTMSISGGELQRVVATNLTLTAPSNGQIIVDGITSAESANITNTTTLTATAGTLGTILFQTGTSSFRTLTATADDGISINSDVSTTIGALTLTSSGAALEVADGVTASTNNAGLTITANDLNLNATGALNSGTGNVIITQNTAGGSIGLGNTTGTMTISGTELQNITANNFNLNAPTNGQIIIDGIAAANVANISDTTTLTATAGALGNMSFQTASSSFKTLVANADDGITVGPGVTLATVLGNMSLNADANGAVGGNDALTLNGNLSATGSMALSALNGGIIINAPSNLTANGITINHRVNGSNNLTIDSGSSATNFLSTVGASTPLGSGVGAALTLNSTGLTTFANTVAANSGIIANGPVTFNNNVTLAHGNTPSIFNSLTLGNTLTFLTNGGNITINGNVSGPHNFTLNAGSSGNVLLNNLNTNKQATIIANNLAGNVHLGRLTFNLKTGNFFGSVGGRTGIPAIRLFKVLNHLVPGKIFFDGYDIFQVLNPAPVPASAVFPTNYTPSDFSLNGLQYAESDWLLYMRLNWMDNKGKKVSNESVLITPYIEMVGKWDQ